MYTYYERYNATVSLTVFNCFTYINVLVKKLENNYL